MSAGVGQPFIGPAAPNPRFSAAAKVALIQHPCAPRQLGITASRHRHGLRIAVGSAGRPCLCRHALTCGHPSLASVKGFVPNWQTSKVTEPRADAVAYLRTYVPPDGRRCMRRVDKRGFRSPDFGKARRSSPYPKAVRTYVKAGLRADFTTYVLAPIRAESTPLNYSRSGGIQISKVTSH